MDRIKANLPAFVLFICEMAVGILLIVNPIGFTSAIIRAVGIGMAVGGAIWCIRYFRTEKTAAAISGMLFEGLICLLAGLFLVLKTNWIITALEIVIILYGILILIIGILKLQWTIDLIRFSRDNWAISAISSLIAIIFAILILLNPFKTQETLWRIAGIALVAQAVFDLIALFACPRIIDKPVEKAPVVDAEAKEVDAGTDEEKDK